MKYLIPFFIAAVLTGCDRTPDTSQVPAGAAETTPIGADPESSTAQAPAGEKAVPWARTNRVGIYEAIHEGRLVEGASSTTGKALERLTIQFVRPAERIPLVKGSYFGFQYIIGNLFPILDDGQVMELRRVLIHPEMTLPDGSTTTGSDYTIHRKVKVGQVKSYDAYGFHEDYELVEGEWAFQLRYQDDLLIEQTFTTYLPEEAAEPAQEHSAPDADSTI